MSWEYNQEKPFNDNLEAAIKKGTADDVRLLLTRINFPLEDSMLVTAIISCEQDKFNAVYAYAQEHPYKLHNPIAVMSAAIKYNEMQMFRTVHDAQQKELSDGDKTTLLNEAAAFDQYDFIDLAEDLWGELSSLQKHQTFGVAVSHNSEGVTKKLLDYVDENFWIKSRNLIEECITEGHDFVLDMLIDNFEQMRAQPCVIIAAAREGQTELVERLGEFVDVAESISLCHENQDYQEAALLESFFMKEKHLGQTIRPARNGL